MFFKIDVLKNFVISTGKHLCWSLFLIKLQAFSPASSLKRDYNAGFFLWILRNFWEQIFYRTPLAAASVTQNHLFYGSWTIYLSKVNHNLTQVFSRKRKIDRDVNDVLKRGTLLSCCTLFIISIKFHLFMCFVMEFCLE